MNIAVSNLDLKFTDADLKNLFTSHGTVASAEIAMDGFTEQSRGFGYVEMPDETEARAAISKLDQTEINGLKIKVEEAEPKDVRKGSYKVGNGAMNVYRFRKN